MIRSFRNCFLAALLAVFGTVSVAHAADAPLAGNWKFKEVSNGSDTTLAILQVEVKDGKTTVTSLSSPLLNNSVKIEDVKASDTSLSFNFKLPNGNVAAASIVVPKDADKAKALRGIISLGAQMIFSELERTDLKEIDTKDARKQGPAAQDLGKARFTADAKEQEKMLRDILEKNGDNAAGYAAADILLATQMKAGAKDEDLKATSETLFKIAKLYGPVAEKRSLIGVAGALSRGEKVSPLALEYARQAEKALTKDDSPATSVAVLKTLVTALKKSGKADEAKTYAASLAKLDKQLDEEFEKNAIPFKPEAPAGRKAKSTRVAVVELFTGAQCPPCVSADIAFDAAVKQYKPADTVFLEYHLHIPGPDALTNTDTEGRQKFYGPAIRGTPTAFVNGKVTEGLGGFKQHGEERYGTLRKIIDEALDTDQQANIKLTATRRGDKIEAEANVEDLKKTGEKVRLRFVLIEDVARYAGGNGQRLHHHVVRALPGGLDGTEMKEAKGTYKTAVVLGDLKKSLNEYLAGRKFSEDDRPMELKNLKLIALIQDDESKEILQAAQVDLTDEK
jgi:hypothetical protein